MLNFYNCRFVDEFIYADVYENDNYIGIFGAEVYHLEYTFDLKNEIFNKFQEFYIEEFASKEKYNHLTLIK